MSGPGSPQRRRGTNLPKMGDFNQAVILDSIRRAVEGLSRVELAASAGLAAQTVSNICRRLLDADLIVEAGKETLGPGKPRTILRLNPRGMYAVGLHIDPAVTSYVLLDAVGKTVLSREEATDLEGDPVVAVLAMGAQIRTLIEASGVDQSRIIGVGVATPGPVDAATGTVVDPPHLPGWKRVPLQDLLQEATGLAVVVEKDVTAAAIAELWAESSVSACNFVFVYIGTGIGAGLVLDGHVVRGSSGNVGEIGHIIVDPDGPPCDCGRRGCVKVACMPETIVAQARDAGILPGIDQLSPAPLMEDLAIVVQAAENGEPCAMELMERSAARMTGAISVLSNLLDVDRVVLGGPFWPVLAATYLERVPAQLTQLSVTSSVHSVEVVGTRLAAGEEAVGAAYLVMEKTFGPNAAHLLLDAKA